MPEIDATPNSAPIAMADSVTLERNTSLTLAPLTNDFDVDVGNTFTLSGFTAPSHGTATLSGTNQIHYIPTTNYCGSDSLTYTIADNL